MLDLFYRRNFLDSKKISFKFDYFQDPRFNRQIDGKTGYKTDSLVCMPVCNYDGEVIGVAQIINKRGGEDNLFTEQDLKVLL